MCNWITADDELEKSKLGAEGEGKKKSRAKWGGKKQALIGYHTLQGNTKAW